MLSKYHLVSCHHHHHCGFCGHLDIFIQIQLLGCLLSLFFARLVLIYGPFVLRSICHKNLDRSLCVCLRQCSVILSPPPNQPWNSKFYESFPVWLAKTNFQFSVYTRYILKIQGQTFWEIRFTPCCSYFFVDPEILYCFLLERKCSTNTAGSPP